MKTFIKNSIFYFIIILMVSFPISWLISKNFHTYMKQNWILNLEKLQLDYAVLGSSRVLNMVDIKSLDSTFNKKGINLGTSGSGYAENFIILSEFLSKNTISTLILNMDEYCFNSKNSYSHPFHEYEFLPLFNKYNEVFEDNIPIWKFYLWKIVPLTKYIEFNDRFHLKKHFFPNQNMGTELIDVKSEEYNKIENKRSQQIILKLDEKYFLKIIQLCAINKIKVVLITTPIFTKNGRYDNIKFNHYIDSISSKLNLNYYDFEGLITNNPNNFKDQTHTNKRGSIEYSVNLGKKLKINNE